MKEAKFIELLNLYVDQQITPAEAAQLEQEILADPRRRQTYRQYCRMHRACTLLHENFHATAGTETARTPQLIAQEVDEFRRPSRRAWRAGLYAASGLAAACVALVLVRLQFSGGHGHAAAAAAQNASASSAALAAGAGQTAALPADRVRDDGFQPVFTADTFNLARAGAPAASGAALPARFSLSSADAPLNWLDTVRLAPLPAQAPDEIFVFGPDAGAALPASDKGFVLRRQVPGSSTPSAEFTAFQFQR